VPLLLPSCARTCSRLLHAYDDVVAMRVDAATSAGRERDLERRIAAAPVDAEIRAVFLQVIDDAVRREGRTIATPKRPRGYSSVPVRNYLKELHDLGALVGPTPEAGIARLHARTASFLLDHPGARLFVTARDRDPFVLLGRLERSRSMMASYGDWRVSGRRGDVVITIRDEWVWIESMWCSVIASVFEACSTTGEVVHEPEGPFSSVVRVRW
jgi:hypothetical protein